MGGPCATYGWGMLWVGRCGIIQHMHMLGVCGNRQGGPSRHVGSQGGPSRHAGSQGGPSRHVWLVASSLCCVCAALFWLQAWSLLLDERDAGADPGAGVRPGLWPGATQPLPNHHTPGGCYDLNLKPPYSWWVLRPKPQTIISWWVLRPTP